MVFFHFPISAQIPLSLSQELSTDQDFILRDNTLILSLQRLTAPKMRKWNAQSTSLQSPPCRKSQANCTFSTLTGALFSITEPETKHERMTFSILLTSPTTYYCLWQELSFVSTRPTNCTSAPCITPYSELEGNVTDVWINIRLTFHRHIGTVLDLHCHIVLMEITCN